MSSVPVLEALRRLEAEGLVEFTRWAGARVAAFGERQLGEAI
jgi:DNA-binding GntR family transcriptional regulator